MFQTQLVSKAKLVRKVINFAEHIECIKLFEITEVIKIHSTTPIQR